MKVQVDDSLLGVRVAMFRRLGSPLCSLSAVLFNAGSAMVHVSEIGLGDSITLFGGLEEPFKRLLNNQRVLRDRRSAWTCAHAAQLNHL